MPDNNTKHNTNESVNTYDEMQYTSYPYSQSHPAHLRSVAKLFGVNAPDIKNARILELGCAAGGNLIPIASSYPESESIGVDFSKLQTEDGQKEIKALGLKNIEIRHASITDIDKSYGKFDYIICHGVFSWVPEQVRNAIFEVCQSLLTDNGIAYISYNTLPGWNMVKSIRDMMNYHASSFQDASSKVQQSRLLLDFVIDSLEGVNTPYAEMLRQESKLLSNQSDTYLRHEHLSEDNEQFYFSDFMTRARAHGLQYLGDSSVASMFLGNIPQKAHEKLKDVNDIVRVEQYMDFINNRRFRATLLCKDNVQITRNIDASQIKDFYMSMKIIPEISLSDTNIEDAVTNIKFFLSNAKDANVATSSPVMKAIFYSISENYGVPLSFDALVKLAKKKLTSVSQDAIAQELISHAMRLVLSGHIALSCDKPNFINTLSAKPEVSKLVRHQVLKYTTGDSWVTNELHERIGLSYLERYTLRYMDGKHKKSDIINKLLEHVKNGDLVVKRNDQSIDDESLLKKELESALDIVMTNAQHNALLVG